MSCGPYIDNLYDSDLRSSIITFKFCLKVFNDLIISRPNKKIESNLLNLSSMQIKGVVINQSTIFKWNMNLFKTSTL